MKITSFNMLVADKEGKRDPQNITQITEITAVINSLLNGLLYQIIALLPEPRARKSS